MIQRQKQLQQLPLWAPPASRPRPPALQQVQAAVLLRLSPAAALHGCLLPRDVLSAAALLSPGHLLLDHLLPGGEMSIRLLSLLMQQDLLPDAWKL